MEVIVPEDLKHLYKCNEENPIVKIPDPILRQHSKPVAKITKKTLELIDKMFDVIEKFDASGLSAVQIGVLERIFVMNVGPNGKVALINPEIIERSGEDFEYEGCMSIPMLYGKVKRPLKVKVKGLNPKGKLVTYTFSGIEARCTEHEIDHFNGILFVDKVDLSTLHWYDGE